MRKSLSPVVTAVAWALLATAAALPTRAQDKSEAIKPADAPSKVVLDSWNDIGRKLIAMAEDFPEDKYDFKPTPAQRTFAEQLLHDGAVNLNCISAMTGSNVIIGESPKRDQYKTKADVVAYLKKSFAAGAAAIRARGDKGLNDLIVDPFEHQQVRVIDWVYGFIEHSGEHYGQLVGYYRLAGLVPPESRPKK